MTPRAIYVDVRPYVAWIKETISEFEKGSGSISTSAEPVGGGRQACTSGGGRGFGTIWSCDGANCAKEDREHTIECIIED